MNQTEFENKCKQQKEEFLREEQRAFWFFIKVYITMVAVLILFGSYLSNQ